MKDKILQIFTNDFEVEEDNGRTFLRLPIHQFKDMSPRFVFEIIHNTENNTYKLSDVKQTVRELQEEYLFTDSIRDKMYDLAPKYRLKFEMGELYVTFDELDHIKYFVSYMIQFIAIIQYLANEEANQMGEELDDDFEDEDPNDIIDNDDY